MSNSIPDMIAEARKAQVNVYLAAPEPVADDLSRIIRGLADALEALSAEPAEAPGGDESDDRPRCAREDRDGRCDRISRPGKVTCAKHARFERVIDSRLTDAGVPGPRNLYFVDEKPEDEALR